MRKRISAWLLALVMVISLVPSRAFAAAGDVPAHSKTVTDNGDGTYTIALNVTGETEKKVTKVNVVIVLDTSGSMSEYTGNTTTTYRQVTASQAYWYNEVYGYVDGEYVLLRQEFDYNTWSVTYYVGDSTEPYEGDLYVQGRSGRETRLQAATAAVKSLSDKLLSNNGKDGNPDDVVEMALVSFATKAAAAKGPTTSPSTFAGYLNSLNADGGTNWEGGLTAAQNVSFGDQDTTYVIFVSDGNPTFRDSQYNSNWNDYNRNYGVYGSGQEQDQNVSRSYQAAQAAAEDMIGAGYKLYTIGVYGNVDRMQGLGGEGYYSASNTDALNAALTEILAKIEEAGIGSVEIEDGTTASVTTPYGGGLLEVDENSFKYYRAGDPYSTTANGGLGDEWTDAPEATLTDGNVTWDLGDDLLENGVTYTVTFDVWPSQDTLDLIADIKNDPSVYDDLDPTLQQYLGRDGSFKTNTGATLSYEDTRTGQSYNEEFTDPDPVSSNSVQMLTVSKEWQNELDNQAAEPVTLTVTRDGEETYDVSLSNDNSWQDTVYISIGIMREDGTVLTSGHDFTFTEPKDLNYHWELDVPVVRPMQIGENVTMLIKVDEKHQPEGAKTYTIDGVQYYVGEVGAAELTAVNYRRSSLMLTKVVEGEDAPEDATFPFTLNVVNSAAASGTANDLDSDYYVWISVRDKDNNRVNEGVTGATPEDGSNGWYYAPSGSDVTIEAKAGYSIRINNLPTGSTYTITEGEMEPGFIFTSAELAITEGNGADSTFSGDRTTTGTIEDNNTLYTVTYTNEYALVDVTVDKVWDDADDQDGIRPDELELTVNGLPEGAEAPDPEIEKSEDGNTWTYTWKGLPKYDDAGEEISYTVSEAEDAVPDGYTCEETTAEPGGTITNKHEPETAEITVTKVWDDAGDQDEVRPDSVAFTVTGSDGNTYDVELTGQGDTWTATVEVQKYYNQGEEVTFEVDEAEVAGYEKTIDNDTLTITNKHDTEKDTITVTKVWEDNGDQDGKRPDSVKFTVTGSDGKTYEVELSGEGDTWTADVEVEKNQNTRALVTFTVDEEDVEGYEKTIDNDTLTITNTYEPETEELTVTKVWDDADDQDGKRPDSVTFTVTGSDGNTYDVELSGEGNEWTGTVEVAKYYNGGEEVTFEVDEAEVAEYEKEIDNENLTITNSYEPETEELTVTKVWDDADDQDGKRPDSVTFTVTGSDGNTYDVELTGEGDTWTGTVEVQKYWNQGEEVTFEVDEAEVAGYEKEIDNENLTITNSYEPETAELTVTKVWDDAGDQDEVRPDSVTFTVTGSDGKTYEVELTGEGDEWTATVEVQKYYNQGEEVTFEVDEAEVAGYEKTIDNDTLTITNKHDTEKTTITVTKVWEDNGDQDGKRPDSVKFTVTGSDGKTYEVELSGEGDTWTADVEVEKNQNTRALVTFTVDEEDVEGYEKSIDNDTLTITNTYEPETEELTVTKVWDDADDQDGKRPDSVTFTVTGSDGNTYDVELSGEGNEWTGTVEVQKYWNQGEEVTFEVDEAEVADYEKEIDNENLTITNSYEPETEELTVTKVWDDADDQDGKRPDSVTFTVTGSDGNTYDVELSGEGNEWTGTVEVAKYYNGGEEVTFEVDEAEVADYEKEIDNESLTITNSYEPETTELTVTKVWDDSNDKDGKRPDSVIFTVTGSDGKTYEVELTGEGNTWTATVEADKYYNSGEEVTFEVDEAAVADYEKTIDNSKLTITNKHTAKENPPLPPLPPEPPVLNTKDHFAYIIGNDQGLVLPNAPITRAEVATIFFRMLTDESRNKIWSQDNPFSDVKLTNWYNNAISTMTNGGILTGYPDGSFRPDANITRAEFATIAIRFFKDAVIGPSAFSDTIGHWAEEYINKAATQGLIKGYPDGTFRPNEPITRAEAMTIVNRVLNRHPDKDHLLANMIVWPDNMDTNMWYYADVQEATNSHDYEMHNYTREELYEIWKALLPVRDWAAFEKAWSTANSAYNPGEVVNP